MTMKSSWNLAVLMAERGIRSGSELSRRLATHGYPITPTYAGKIVREAPRELNLELLKALVAVLECTSDELLGLSAGQGRNPVQRPAEQPAIEEPSCDAVPTAIQDLPDGLRGSKRSRHALASLVDTMPGIMLHPRANATKCFGDR